MSMTKEPFNDRDEQAAWEFIGRHKSIEPSFGFADRVLRRLEEQPARALWQLPAFRWATGLSLAMVLAMGTLHWQNVREARPAEIYAAATQDSLEDYDVIANLDLLTGDSQL